MQILEVRRQIYANNGMWFILGNEVEVASVYFVFDYTAGVKKIFVDLLIRFIFGEVCSNMADQQKKSSR